MTIASQLLQYRGRDTQRVYTVSDISACSHRPADFVVVLCASLELGTQEEEEEPHWDWSLCQVSQ